MKKRFLKVLAAIMSVAVLCASLSVGSFALDSQRFDVNLFDGKYVDLMVSNDSKTIAFFEASNEDGDEWTYAYTTNGTDFKEVDFSELVPECDYYELGFYDVHDNNFAFLLCCYDVYEEYDEELQGFYEVYEVVDFVIVTTTDFVSFNEIELEVESEMEILPGDYDSFYGYGYFGFVGDELVFANGDYVTAKSKDDGDYGYGVFYTTKDFENWEVNLTQESIIWDNEEEWPVCFVYQPYGDALIIWNEYEYLDEYLYADGEFYGVVSAEYSEAVDWSSWYFYSEENPSTLLRVDEIYTEEYYEGDGYAEVNIVSHNLNTGEEIVVFQGEQDFYCDFIELNGNIYIQTLSFDEETAAVYEVTKDNEFKAVETTYNYIDLLFKWYVGEEFYCIYSDKIQIFRKDLSNSLDIDVSDLEIEEMYDTFAFEISGKLYIIETPEGGKNSYVYVTDADLTQYGDVTGEGVINSADALKVLQRSTGLVELDEKQAKEADVNLDGRITSADALLILQYATGLIHSI